MTDHEFELTVARLFQIASLMKRGQLTQPRKVGRELHLLAGSLSTHARTNDPTRDDTSSDLDIEPIKGKS